MCWLVRWPETHSFAKCVQKGAEVFKSQMDYLLLVRRWPFDKGEMRRTWDCDSWSILRVCMHLCFYFVCICIRCMYLKHQSILFFLAYSLLWVRLRRIFILPSGLQSSGVALHSYKIPCLKPLFIYVNKVISFWG